MIDLAVSRVSSRQDFSRQRALSASSVLYRCHLYTERGCITGLLTSRPVQSQTDVQCNDAPSCWPQMKVMNLNSKKQVQPARRAPKWNQYFFRLREGLLTKSPPRRSSFPGNARQAEDMVLTSSTLTSYTNTKNCFCIRTGDVRALSCVCCALL